MTKRARVLLPLAGLSLLVTLVLPVPAASADDETASAETSTSGEQEAPSGTEEPIPPEPAEQPTPTVEPTPTETGAAVPASVAAAPVPAPTTAPVAAPVPAPAAAPETSGAASKKSRKKATLSSVLRKRLRAPAEKVTICHRTRSRTNPYNQLAVAAAGAVSGHANHTGPIFAPDVDDWGDIIPPTQPDLPNGLNWPAGREILKDGCEMAPDPGPDPAATIGDVVCVGTDPTVEITVTNGADATAPATFAIFVAGAPVPPVVGPVPPGETETVTVTLSGTGGGGLAARENQGTTIEVRSDGEVIASRVVTPDCAPGPPPLAIAAQLTCVGATAQGTATVTNNGPGPVQVSATVDGVPAGSVVVVGPGATETGTVDLSQYEDRTITVNLVVDGVVVATYTATPDCVPPQANPSVRVAGQECPPPSATVTLGNTGDPDSQVVFVIRIDGQVVQTSAPLYGGDTTTIVGDLARFEDQTVTVELRANGEVLGSRTIEVDCEPPDSPPGEGTAGAGAAGGPDGPGTAVLPAAALHPDTAVQPDAVQPAGAGTAVLPSVGASFSATVLALGLGLVAVGSLLVATGGRRRGLRAARR
jgi:hypothetical protein